MSVNRCACGETLGTLAQLGTAKCIKCQTKDRIRHIIALIALLPEPDDGDGLFNHLTDWEQEFLTSVREQFSRRGTLSEKQVEILERIYAK